MVTVPTHLVGLQDDLRTAVVNAAKIDIFDISTGNGTADRQFILPGTIVDLARANGGNHIVAAYSNKIALLDWTTGTTPLWTDTMTKNVASVVAIPQSSTYFVIGEDDQGSLDARIIGWDHTTMAEDFNFATANLPDKFIDVTVSHDAEYMFAIDEAGI